MSQKFKMEKEKKDRNTFTVLITPLDWGLGHATRCIPIISCLLQQRVRVIVCGEGDIITLIQKEFPDIETSRLKGYRIRYSKKRNLFFLKLLLQIPKIIYSIIYENIWLKAAIKKYDIDAIISDNRLGCFNKSITSVFITHQLHIKAGFSFVDQIVRSINYFFINKYDECWVPDYPSSINLAGDLSHPKVFPDKPVHYIGLLSRMKKTDIETKYKLCIVLSGPEPQRTNLEKIIVSELTKYTEPTILIRGLPNERNIIRTNQKNINIVNYAGAQELSSIIQQSEIIISRSGYSTVMDVLKLNKRAIFIPTPGQTEQEYLASYLDKKKLCIAVSQEDFELKIVLNQLNTTLFNKNEFPEMYQDVVINWLNWKRSQRVMMK